MKMTRYLKKNKNEIGLSPQELIFRGNRKIEEVGLRLIDFDESEIEEKSIKKTSEIISYSKKESVTWLNIDGLHDLEILKEIGEKFDLNNFILADILETNSRPKIHEYENWIFISVKILEYDQEIETFTVENLSIIFNDLMLITFQEKKGDIFEPVRERIRNQKRTLRSSGPDYLVFALLDTVIDHYLYILSNFSEKIESFDEMLLEEPDKKVIEGINHSKRELNHIQRGIKSAKDMIFALSKLESDFISEKNDIHFKELVYNINQASESADSLRELLTDQLNIYHMMISSKLNDIMKFLTIFSVIFIPLTFIAGIYGTNFDVLPELHFKNGYFLMLGSMVIIAILMLLYFKRKKWL